MEATKTRPRCWWCGEESRNLRVMEAGEQHFPVCGACYLALEALRKRAAKRGLVA